MMKKIIGIGNALTDIVININSESIIRHFGLPKGSMSLVDSEKQKSIAKHTAGLPRTLSLGGSAGNTIRTLARMGATTGFIGKIGRDNTGDYLLQALVNLGIEPHIFRGAEHSGRCISLVTPDGERTMATHLGAALELSQAEINPPLLKAYDCLYIEGYLVQDQSLIEGVVKLAKECGLKVAIDLASFNIVAENLEFLRRLVTEHVDILFANEDEAKEFTGETNPMNALEEISRLCEVTVIKAGIKGAYIKYRDEITHAGIMVAAKRVDTTGAGDFYAAGFLYGMCRGMSMQQCGTIGAIAAGKVIEVVGTTLGKEACSDIFRLIRNVESQRDLF
jgi:sugar/nucleoside kinase (ribokinase family)